MGVVLLVAGLGCAPSAAWADPVGEPPPAPATDPASPPPDFVVAALADVDGRITKLRSEWTGPALPADVAGVAHRLALLRAVDDTIRRAIPPPLSTEADAARWRQGLDVRAAAADGVATAELRRLVERHGWIVASRFGPRAADTAFRLLLHADAATQAELLPRLEPLARAGEVRPRDYATLVDRVRIAAGDWQRYGTQGRCRGEAGWVPLPIDHPGAVDRLRAEIGLERLVDHIGSFDCDGRRAAARAAYEAGDWAGCLHANLDLARAREGHPRANAWFDAARCAARGGDLDGASRWLRRALGAGLDDPDRAGTEPDLAPLRADARWARVEAKMP